MNLSNRRPTNASLRTEAWTPGDSLQLDALVGACALVAYADGWVTAEERRRLVARVQGLPAFGVFGVDEAIQAFEALIERFDKDPDDGRRWPRRRSCDCGGGPVRPICWWPRPAPSPPPTGLRR
uniref:Tellurite resistance TerB family protein n=1 Tax=Phenylobacterium glaciei TaxID=2803784 RepID=A0A974P2T5_9CAUL|nr:tellurite resistance TerB family protein [Phenylobacterium glaciei]